MHSDNKQKPFHFKTRMHSLLGIADRKTYYIEVPPTLSTIGFKYISYPFMQDLTLDAFRPTQPGNLLINNEENRENICRGSETDIIRQNNKPNDYFGKKDLSQTQDSEIQRQYNAKTDPVTYYGLKKNTLETNTITSYPNSTKVTLEKKVTLDKDDKISGKNDKAISNLTEADLEKKANLGKKVTLEKKVTLDKDDEICGKNGKAIPNLTEANLEKKANPGKKVTLEKKVTLDKDIDKKDDTSGNNNTYIQETRIEIPGVSERNISFPALLDKKDKKNHNLKSEIISDNNSEGLPKLDHADISMKVANKLEKSFKERNGSIKQISGLKETKTFSPSRFSARHNDMTKNRAADKKENKDERITQNFQNNKNIANNYPIISISSLPENPRTDDVKSVRTEVKSSEQQEDSSSINSRLITQQHNPLIKLAPYGQTLESGSSPKAQIHIDRILGNQHKKNENPYTIKSGTEDSNTRYVFSENFTQSRIQAINRIERLRDAVHRLSSKVHNQQETMNRMVKQLQSEQAIQNQTPPSVQQFIYIKQPPNRSRTPSAFWERSYLGRSHFRILR